MTPKPCNLPPVADMTPAQIMVSEEISPVVRIMTEDEIETEDWVKPSPGLPPFDYASEFAFMTAQLRNSGLVDHEKQA